MKKIASFLALSLLLTQTSHMAISASTDVEMRSQQTDLNVVWEVSPSTNDKMSTISTSEASQFPMDGQMFYLPKLSDPLRVSLNRLFHSYTDHMDSLSTNEGGYSFESSLGNPWLAAFSPLGTSQLIRGFNPITGDHSLMSNFLNFPGYNNEYMTVYGYPRFGGGTSLFELNGSEVTVKSNLAAGGTIWELWWNGKQFVNHLDYGREIQSSLSFSDGAAGPTEGGDQLAGDDKNFMHGAPIASYSNSITSSAKTQSTRAIPLEWFNNYFNGGLSGVPVAYANWQLGKDIILDDTTIDLGVNQYGADYSYLNNQVIRYKTVLNTPIQLTNANIEIPTAYLTNEFTRTYTFDATVWSLRDATVEISNSDYTNMGTGIFYKSYTVSSGGVICANSTLTHAIGIYGSTPETGGDVDCFTLWKFGIITNPDTVKWSACSGPAKTINSGENVYQTFICVGTMQEVQIEMRRLYEQGYR